MAGRALLAVLGAACPHPSPAAGSSRQYCIVGGGPGGLQLGQFLLAAGRDYVIFERGTGPGSFFERFPIHRQLISLNKRHTGRDNPEFNMRHDWNSLLGNEACAPVTNRTTARFPRAEVLAEYLEEYARPQEAAGRIEYGADVQRVSRAGSLFRLQVVGASGERAVRCEVVIMANGIGVPNEPQIEGAELLTGYESLPPTGEGFEGKRVAILGMGNSAFEVANAAADFASYVHIWPTRDRKKETAGWPHTSWESRYVGSQRGIRTSHLDGYLLKSLDGMPLGNGIVAEKGRLMVKPCYETQLCLFHLLPDRPKQFRMSSHNELDMEQMAAIERLKQDSGIRIDILGLPQGIDATVINEVQEGQTRETWLTLPGKALMVPVEDVTNETVAHIMEWRKKTGDTLAQPYDIIVRAMGWHYNTSVFDESALPRMQSQRKYPQMTHEYESVNVPGMYFAGTLAHGKDWKRASGGFIHGFRYTARALHHILEAKHEGVPWGPSRDFKVPSENAALAQHVMDRINSAAGPYQMFYTLGDGMVLLPGDDDEEWTVRYHEEMPVDYFNKQYSDHHRMMWVFGFDGQHRTLTESLSKGTGFEPWIWHWPPATGAGTGAAPTRAEVFRMTERKIAMLSRFAALSVSLTPKVSLFQSSIRTGPGTSSRSA